MSHWVGDRCSGGHIGPPELAEFMVEEGWTRLGWIELSDDIRRDPELYYPEFQRMCAELDTRDLRIDVWVDKCHRAPVESSA